jgi:hypothetical protein
MEQVVREGHAADGGEGAHPGLNADEEESRGVAESHSGTGDEFTSEAKVHAPKWRGLAGVLVAVDEIGGGDDEPQGQRDVRKFGQEWTV